MRLRRPRLFRHPAQVVVGGFGLAVLVGTLLLMLPVAQTGIDWTDPVTALFTATSAVCVTGLVVVDTGTYWSTFGEVVILALIQVGGLGTMTLASLLGLAISRKLGLRARVTAATETKAVGLGDVREVVIGVARTSLVVELAVAVVLALRFWAAYDVSPGRAAYLGVFHSVSAFNNAGFALWPDSLVRFATDPWICLPIAASVIVGGIGFPVILELRKRLRTPRAWSMHTKMTLWATAVLLVLGTLVITANEWRNPATLGQLDTPGRLLAGFFQAVMPRTAGFNSVDTGAMLEGSLLVTVVLMFIGGGSAGTAGGIKVTTFVLLLLVIWAEVRGERDVQAFDRRIGERVVRQALTIALLSVGLVTAATVVLVEITRMSTHLVLFEVVSAFGTVGLSTGITADVGTAGHLVLAVLMFVGRLGPITLVSALALRERQRLYHHPEGRPLIG
ncbi:potassium transporter TrkG [uncultured Nocardioides sp.]|uniref:TrkH family potassium uptake protein n=1 Tax=uncultured Nocardioides sp. TaxID=198441 RepID=UPI00261C7585|nr:potassium transporter TrkG [uncultured Nocardioides sp.]